VLNLLCYHFKYKGIEINMDAIVTPKQRQIRIERIRSDDLKKIELATLDVGEIEIDTKILNKLKRRMGRRH
jgi:hypothetical protein